MHKVASRAQDQAMQNKKVVLEWYAPVDLKMILEGVLELLEPVAAHWCLYLELLSAKYNWQTSDNFCNKETEPLFFVNYLSMEQFQMPKGTVNIKADYETWMNHFKQELGLEPTTLDKRR